MGLRAGNGAKTKSIFVAVIMSFYECRTKISWIFMRKLAHEPCVLGLDVVKYWNDCEVDREKDV